MAFVKSLVALVGVLFACAVAVILLVVLPGGGRMPLSVGVVALGCALAAWGCRVAYVRLKAVVEERNAQELAALSRTTRFEASQRGFFMIALFGVLIAATGLVAFSALRDERSVLAVACGVGCLFFLAGSLELIRQALRPGATLVMDPRGIDHAMCGRIPWEEVVGLELKTISVRGRDYHVLCLGLRKPHRFFDQLSWTMRMKHGAWRERGLAYGALAIPLHMLDKRAELIHGAAVRFREQVGAPLLEAWYEKMPPALVEAMLVQQSAIDELERAARTSDFAAAERAHARIEAMSPTLERQFGEEATRLRKSARVTWVLGSVVLLLLVAKAWATFA